MTLRSFTTDCVLVNQVSCFSNSQFTFSPVQRLNDLGHTWRTRKTATSVLLPRVYCYCQWTEPVNETCVQLFFFPYLKTLLNSLSSKTSKCHRTPFISEQLISFLSKSTTIVVSKVLFSLFKVNCINYYRFDIP